jgi:hypothetical protein
MIEQSYMMKGSLRDKLTIEILFDTGKTYLISRDFAIKEKVISETAEFLAVSVEMGGAELRITGSDNRSYVIPWDYILHHFEPDYKYYIKKK